MRPLRVSLVFASLGAVLTCGLALAQDSSERLSRQARMDIIRSLNAESVFARRAFPMGEGLALKNGELDPDEETLHKRVMAQGAAVRPGDRARITNVRFRGRSIVFEINGGPRQRRKWYERLEVGGLGGTMSPGDMNPDPRNPRGSFVALVFDGHIPNLTPDEVRELLAPVFNFHTVSAAEAYLETIPENVRDAIENREVLVGMNREMVVHAKGRPPRRIREIEGGVEFEEWIYGQPPQDVEFVRFLGDEVVRLTIMAVTGERVVKTEKEVDTTQFATGLVRPRPGEGEAEAEAEASATPARRPTLRRPGEQPGADDPRPASTASDETYSEPEWGKPAPPPQAPPPERKPEG
jgi:hypothetical protein